LIAIGITRMEIPVAQPGHSAGWFSGASRFRRRRRSASHNLLPKACPNPTQTPGFKQIALNNHSANSGENMARKDGGNGAVHWQGSPA